MSRADPTFVGQVASVTGSQVRVRLQGDLPTTSLLVEGHAYRVGQIGAFMRIPLGYTQLFGVCTQVGADAAPLHEELVPALEAPDEDRLAGYQWMTVVLFGEALGGRFDRGVGQYPTVGDEVHLVTENDLQMIYRQSQSEGSVDIGEIASSSGIPARLSLARLVSRHACVLGSTGSGKSNLVTVLLESISGGQFPRARVLVIDPHGEYAAAVGDKGYVFSIRPDHDSGEQALWVPFWALPLTELVTITMTGLQPNVEALVRDQVLAMKRTAAQHLAKPPPEDALTADSPVPFSFRKLWFDLDDFEHQTFKDDKQGPEAIYDPEQEGDPDKLKPNVYPAYSAYNKAPFQNRQRRHIARQLDLLRSRLSDTRLSFMFAPGDGLDPSIDGKVQRDIDGVIAAWVGHDRPITVLDVSGVPNDVTPTVVGTMLRLIYDVLVWGTDLPVGGRKQPLLVVLEEAHRFLGEGADTPAHRIVATIAKEGRKYGVGLLVVSQRPVEVEASILSQCGTMIALRTTNGADRNRVAAAFPDDLGNLAGLLPALRTGEALILGEAMHIPSRARIRPAKNKPIGTDPKLPEVWQIGGRPDLAGYQQAVANWRAQSTAAEVPKDEGGVAPNA